MVQALDDHAMEIPEAIDMVVDGETFRAVADPDQPGAWHVDWTSGPHAGYGFSTRGSDEVWGPRAELEAATRNFLEQVDPATGYIED